MRRPLAAAAAQLRAWPAACAHAPAPAGAAAAAQVVPVVPGAPGGPSGGVQVHDAASLVRAMHDRWAGRWYRTVSFQQRTSRVLPGDSVAVETWWEWAALPGRLKIRMGEAAEGRGVIYSGDSTYVIRSGAVARRSAGRNPLLILGFDVYAQPPERTLELLRAEGFDLSALHSDTWEGKPVWVVGAAPGDLRTKQFWVEQDRLLFVRLLEPNPADSTRTNDVRFARYVPLGRAWIAPLVEVWNGPRRVFWEEYSELRADPPLPPDFFDPDHWIPGAP